MSAEVGEYQKAKAFALVATKKITDFCFTLWSDADPLLVGNCHYEVQKKNMNGELWSLVVILLGMLFPALLSSCP